MTLERRVISEFLRSIGPWIDYVVIGGGFAPIIYALYLVQQPVKNPPVATRDIDSLIARRLPSVSMKSLAKHLLEAGFNRISRDVAQPPTEAYVKEIDGVEIEIEFLTDQATRGDKNRNVQISGISAQPLRYLTLSLQETSRFRTESGESGLVVTPGAWIFHKGLTFTHRTDRAKVYKDLYGVWYVASQLGELSKKAIIRLREFGLSRPTWLRVFQNNLDQWLSRASPRDWNILEQQDPSGYLKQLNFQRLVERLLEQ
jgi:hypothetical protein